MPEHAKKQKGSAFATVLSFCTPAGGRTLDTLIKSQVLYQLSYKRILVVLRVQRYALFLFPPNFFAIFFCVFSVFFWFFLVLRVFKPVSLQYYYAWILSVMAGEACSVC